VSEHPTIYETLGAVMRDVGHVAKREKNAAQNFNFRGIDAVINTVGPVFRQHGVVPIPIVESAEYDEVSVGRNQTKMRQCTVRITYRFYGPAGDFVDSTVVAESMDSGDKATAKAHSVAYRTCLLQVLAIPTDEPDPDASSYERSPAAPAAPVGPVIPGEVAEALVATMDRLGGGVKQAWMDRFGVPPASLSADRGAEATAWVREFEEGHT